MRQAVCLAVTRHFVLAVNCDFQLKTQAHRLARNDVALPAKQHVAHETALLSNLSSEYFPGPVTYSSKKPPMMLRFL
jgi:hypothetical protein